MAMVITHNRMDVFYAIAADTLLLIHVLVVAFIVLGQSFIVLGKWRD